MIIYSYFRFEIVIVGEVIEFLKRSFLILYLKIILIGIDLNSMYVHRILKLIRQNTRISCVKYSSLKYTICFFIIRQSMN